MNVIEKINNLEHYFFYKACLSIVSYIAFFFYMNNISASLLFYLAKNLVDNEIIS